MDSTDLWLAMRQTKYNRTLNSISGILSDSDADPFSMVASCFNEFVAALHAETGTLWVHQRFGDGLIHPVAVYRGNLPENFTIKLGEGIAGSSIRDSKGFIIADCQQDPRWAGKADSKTGFITKSMLCTPLIVEGNCIGCIQIINKLDGLLFDNMEFEFATQLTNGVSTLFAERNLVDKLQTGRRILNKATYMDVIQARTPEEARTVIEQIETYSLLKKSKQKKLARLLIKLRELDIEANNSKTQQI